MDTMKTLQTVIETYMIKYELYILWYVIVSQPHLQVTLCSIWKL